ncbi:MAG: hypothetical protein BGO05_28100 [Rhizobiales bacterium 63-7]|nr:MAG: hypothetical protein BGO05_28100 [Rhizobiales bacterium 63-7]
MLRMNFRVIAQISETLHKIVVNLRSGCGIADDKDLASEIGPVQLDFVGERMAAREYGKDPFRP